MSTAETNGAPTGVVLTPQQAAYVRRLLYRELSSVAEVIADQASRAVEPDGGDDVSGDDAEGTIHAVLPALVSALGAVGWSVKGDMGRLIAGERAM
jgi:hypothetical protein